MQKYYTTGQRYTAQIAEMSDVQLPWRVRVWEYYPVLQEKLYDKYLRVEVLVCDCVSLDEAWKMLGMFSETWFENNCSSAAESWMLAREVTVHDRRYGSLYDLQTSVCIL